MTDNEVAQPGGKLGGRIAKLTADASVYARQRMAGHQNRVAQKVLGDFTNHVSDEIQAIMGPLWRMMAEDPEVPPEIRPLLHALGNGRGQALAWIAGSATGAAFGAGLMGLLTNYLAPVINPLIAASPHGILSPETAAAAQIRGFGWTGERYNLEWDANAGGIDRKRWHVMQRLSETHPTVDMLQELWRRDEIRPGDFSGTIKALGIPDKWAERIIGLSQREHTISDVEAMWNRSIMNDSEALYYGKRAGFSEDQTRRFLELGGEPLPPEMLGEAFRRGKIDRTRFNRGIVQGPIRNEWFDVLEFLQYRRMSTVDAADAVNQGHMSTTAGRDVAKANGLDADDFEILLETAGQPPGIAFAQEALNRGMVSQGEFDTMFLESRIKNRYLDLLRRMRIRLIPQETARLMYRNGVYTREKATKTLLGHGFSPDDAADLLSLEESRTSDDTRALTRAQIVSMYADRMIGRDKTIQLLVDIGYSPSDSIAQVELADLSRVRKYVNSVVTKIRGAYVVGRMTEPDASAQLDRLGIPPDMKDDLFAVWDIERTTVTKTLTPAQVRQAFHKSLISGDEAQARLEAQGYDTRDAGLYLQLTG